MANHPELPRGTSLNSLLLQDPTTFRTVVLENNQKYEDILQYALGDGIEGTLFLYDAIQDVKKSPNIQRHASMLTLAFDMYVDEKFKLLSAMDSDEYINVSNATARMKNGNNSFQDLGMVTRILDKVSLNAVMKIYQRMREVKTEDVPEASSRHRRQLSFKFSNSKIKPLGPVSLPEESTLPDVRSREQIGYRELGKHSRIKEAWKRFSLRIKLISH
jgi:hypothetical protein